jgi:hypothetical protein
LLECRQKYCDITVASKAVAVENFHKADMVLGEEEGKKTAYDPLV